ncbi:MAG TPA: ATP-binding protein [Thermoanaerobaculia bacterium]|nr:ATP-binding protein [Thermoanaerobaculia bacterium]
MRLALQGVLLLALFYLLAVVGLVWWAHHELNQAAHAVMEESAAIVGREVAGVVSETFVADLLEGDPANRRRLLNLIYEITQRSAMVDSVEVVDAGGEVFASHQFEAIGRHRLPPGDVFGADRRPLLVAERRGALEEARYQLQIPLEREGELVGYLRLGLASAQLGRLYERSEERLFLVALLGLALIGALALVLHLQLSRGAQRLTRVLQGALVGEEVAFRTTHDEFGEALQAAGRLGEELRQERARSLQAGRRLNRLAHLMDVGLLVLGPNRRLEFATHRARSLFAVPENADEEQWREALAPLEGILHEAEVGRQRDLQGDVEIPRAGRSRQIRYQIHLLDDDNHSGFLVQVRDREVLHAVETDLRLAAQLRVLTRVYRGVAHDLKAPINAMVLNLELLRRSLAEEAAPREDQQERQRRWVEVVERELQRLHRSLEVLLAQTAPATEVAERFDLRPLIAEVRALLEPQARQQEVEISEQLPDDEVPVRAHRDQIKQAVLNIAINGLEVMPQGGRLQFDLAASDRSARLAIRDSGPGIPPDIRDRVFEMHFTTKETGTGIGLHVARSIVESEGGELDTADTGPEGTTFELQLPLQAEGS